LERLNDQLQSQNAIFKYIREPARKLAEQVRELEEAARTIHKMLVPVHHTLFRDLERGAIFFDPPLNVPVSITDTVSINKAHQYGEGDSTDPIFIAAVLTDVMGVRDSNLRRWNLVKRTEEYFDLPIDSLDEHIRETVTALRRILGLSPNLQIGEKSVLKQRFEILRDICHRPFKSEDQAAFDANLCYGFFDHDPGGRPRTPCQIKPPNQPEQFLHGCYSFLQPRAGWTDKAKEQLRIDPNVGSLELTLKGNEGDFEPIHDHKRLWHLLMHTSRTTESRKINQDDLESAKTYLWDWATSGMAVYASEATHVGNLLGALVLIFGNLAASLPEPSNQLGMVIFESENVRGRMVTINASSSQRSVKIQNAN
jgi:hypothetical protein